jgi:hypothetical protein
VRDASHGVERPTIAAAKRKRRAVRGVLQNGAGEEIRTPDPRITNALLYQLSYSGAKGRKYTQRAAGGKSADRKTAN